MYIYGTGRILPGEEGTDRIILIEILENCLLNLSEIWNLCVHQANKPHGLPLPHASPASQSLGFKLGPSYMDLQSTLVIIRVRFTLCFLLLVTVAGTSLYWSLYL